MERTQLIEMTRRFVDAFNRNDLVTVMEFFAADGVYDEFNGRRNVGKAAIRAAFEPQFTGAFGKMQFLDEDLFADAESGKVMASWRCTLTVKGKPTSWRGLDLLHFAGDKLVRKLTYAKAKSPLFQD
ncbi:MAG: nuclear transport factor 2 family protein [Candidatus Binataceae bacterium]